MLYPWDVIDETPTLPGFPGAADFAARLAAWMDEHQPDGAWFWIDGGAFGEPARSYLGLASEVRYAFPGTEETFVDELHGALTPSPRDSTPEDSTADVFTGGWVVSLGYEFGLARMGVAAPTTIAPTATAPTAIALRAPAVIEVDEATGVARLHAEPGADLAVWQAQYEAITAYPLPAWHVEHGASPRFQARSDGGHTDEAVRWRYSDDDYRDLIVECQRLIAEGEAYVLCLTNQATITQASDSIHASAARIAAALRARSEAPRSGVISTPRRALVAASPERFLTVRGRTVTTAPIKGTRPRGKTPDEDRALARELATSPKERAENTMIVDLLRNDLSRVCEPASVQVESLCEVESYQHVHQLVSVVTGRLAEGIDIFELLDSAFPGGSMTGAPKRSAIEHLQTLESGERGLYSGCFGWIRHDGASDLAMTIRSAEVLPDRITVGAGGGITSDSQPDEEVAELHLKARAVLESVAGTMR